MVKWLLGKDALRTHDRLGAALRSGCQALAEGRTNEYPRILEELKRELSLNDE